MDEEQDTELVSPGGQMISLDIDKLPYVNDENHDYAADLFGTKGFCLIRNFLSPVVLETLVTRYTREDALNLLETDGSYHQMWVKYFFNSRCRDMDPDVLSIVKSVYTVRNQIALQKNSDQFLLQYCLRYDLDPNRMSEIVDHQLSHSFIRVVRYKNGQGQKPHTDFPGELQCIVPLSKKSVDYDQGGLVIINDDTELDVDSEANPGDLIILNAYHKQHRVDPVVSNDQQIGRLHLFLPIIPEFIFARGKGFYFFHGHSFRIHSSVNVGKMEKCKQLSQHMLDLATGKAEAIDRLEFKR